MERIQIIREEINAFLEESLHDAEITGELSKLKRGKMFKIPSYFRLPNGVYEFPEELLKELKEAGYSFQQGVGKENEIYYIFACRE